MNDQQKLEFGHYVRGLIFLDRENLTSAKEALVAAGDFPNARRQIPFILRDLGAPATEIMTTLVATLNSGDLQALPWIIKFNEEFEFSHPNIKQFEEDLQLKIKEVNQSVLLGLMRIARENQDYATYVEEMLNLVNLGNPYAKCELGWCFILGHNSPLIYEELRKQKKQLPSLNGILPKLPELPFDNKGDLTDYDPQELEFLTEDDFAYLNELLKLGEISIYTDAHIMQFRLDLRRKRFKTFEEYIEEFDGTGDDDLRWQDPRYLISFCFLNRVDKRDGKMMREILSALREYGLSEFLQGLLSTEFYEGDLMDESDLFGALPDFIRTPSKVDPKVAISFFDKYESPLFRQFIKEFEKSPAAASKKYSEYMERAIAGDKIYFQCTAEVLEFIDRGYFDFDLVDPNLHGMIMKKLPSLIENSAKIPGELLEYLYWFEDGKAYFLDDIKRRIANHPNTPKVVRDDFYSVNG